MPDLLANVLAEHTYDPVSDSVSSAQHVIMTRPRFQVPISTSVRKCASNFKKTHQDTWQEDSKRFNEEQLAALSTLLTGSSYCECALALFRVGCADTLCRRLDEHDYGLMT